MHKQYGKDVEFLLVYCREAHAVDSDRPSPIQAVEQPVSTEERRKVAAEFVKNNKIEIPTLLDNIDDKASTDYATLPDRLFLVGKDGKIAFSGDPGPRGFQPELLKSAIESELGIKPSPAEDSTETAPPERGQRGQRGQRGGGNFEQRFQRMMSRIPLSRALDADGDGSMSAEEIEGASKALESLDANGDGKLSAEELLPSRRR